MVAKVPKAGPSVTASSIITNMECKGLECSVRIDKKSLEVYQAQRVGDVNSGYIESQSGKLFDVSVEDKRAVRTDFSVHVFIDGTRRCAATNRKEKRPRSTYRGERTGPTTIRPFMFADLQTTDDDAVACTDESFVKDVGSIVVKFRRVKVVGVSANAKVYNPTTASIIDERAKKGSISHQTAFAPDVSTSVSEHRIRADLIDPRTTPFVEFRFNYRSKMLLEMNDIIEVVEPEGEPVAGPSREAAKVKLEKKDGKRTTITIDSSDDEAPPPSKRVKAEKGSRVKQEIVVED